MEKDFSLSLAGQAERSMARALEGCNALTERFGLILSEGDVRGLMQKRTEALRDMGRVEFGHSILTQLAEAFCDSAYIQQETWAETLATLIEAFYYFKNESEDLIPDDELIAFMRERFDGPCHGSIEWMADMTLEELCRDTRYGGYPDA